MQRRTLGVITSLSASNKEAYMVGPMSVFEVRALGLWHVQSVQWIARPRARGKLAKCHGGVAAAYFGSTSSLILLRKRPRSGCTMRVVAVAVELYSNSVNKGLAFLSAVLSRFRRSHQCLSLCWRSAIVLDKIWTACTWLRRGWERRVSRLSSPSPGLTTPGLGRILRYLGGPFPNLSRC